MADQSTKSVAKGTPEEKEEKTSASAEVAVTDSDNSVAPPPPVAELERVLLDTKEPVAKRNRCIFYLKHHHNEAAVRALAKGMRVESTLLSHEAAYVLGQMQMEYANSFLVDVLKDDAVPTITRHEAAEALGAIGSPESLVVLRSLCQNAPQEITDTCHLAVARIEWAQEQKQKEKEAEAAEQKQQQKQQQSLYSSVDPAPAEHTGRTVAQHKDILCNEQLPLFQRYRAMFALRNINTKEAVLALAEGFADSTSAVFRHEVAYVMGQMQNEAAVPSLSKVLQNMQEHAMVRHEAAEALGSIGNTQCLEVLEKFRADRDTVVKQSCDVALDIADYWNSDEQM